MIDLQPAAQRTIHLVTSVTDEQLGSATPCPQMCLGDLIDHLGAFAVVFGAAARKQSDGLTRPPSPDAANLGPGWRDRITHDLLDLAEQWRDPEAWDGLTAAGGLEMPGEVAGLVAIDELVVHGWDVAVATGRPYAPNAPEIQAALAFVESFEAPRDGDLFGPVVPVADDATELDRLLGLAGRDPAWRPPG